MTTKYAGDTWVFDVTVLDSDDDPYPLTTQTFKWALSRRAYSNALLTKDSAASPSPIVITNGAGGVIRVTVPSSDTQFAAGRYYHEVEMTEDDGSVWTVLAEDLDIAATVIPNA